MSGNPLGHGFGGEAEMLGDPRQARTVGWAIAGCPEDVPWHRVVNARGRISLRSDGEGCPMARSIIPGEVSAWVVRIDASSLLTYPLPEC